ncbi:MAG: VOC family protein [Tumebacillaceae bacterium]
MKLIPYLSFDGTAEEALKFYAEVFGGEVTHVQRYSDAPGMQIPEGYDNKLLHGRVQFGDNWLYASDVAREVAAGGQITLSVEFDSEEKIDKAFAQLAEGGTVLMALDKMFWGAKYGKLTDKFGVQWDLNHQFQAL